MANMIHSEFHELFKPPVVDTAKKKSDKLAKISKSKNARKNYSMSRDMRGIASGILREMLHKNGSADAISLLMSHQTQRSDVSPYIELNSNGSQFCVFASIRQCVLDHQLKNAAISFSSTFSNIFSNELRDSEEEDADTKPKEPVLKVPKVVALGICMSFELIRESRHIHQQLCIRALKALLNTLQALSPEALKNEPSDVINPLFELLSELASSSSGYCADNSEPSTSASSANASDSCQSQLKCYACSALLSLVVARGDTGKILSAVAALLTSPQLTSDNSDIETPNILITLQRSVHSVLLGKKKRPDWVTHGFPISSFCDSFRVQIFSETYTHSHQSSLAFDGKYLYLYSGNIIYKIGSGYCGTVKGQLINSCSIGSHKSQSGQIGWIGSVGDFLYLQTNNWTRNELIKLDKDLMKEMGKVAVGVTNWGPTACASDNDSLILITSTKDDCFVIRTLKPTSVTSSSHTINASNASNSSNSANQMSVIQELTIKLSHKCLSVCGGIGSTIFDKSLSPNEQMKQNMLRSIDNIEADDIMQMCAGKDFAVIRTQNGKILFTGKAQSLGIKQNGSTVGKWCELPITKTPKIEHIAVGHEGAHALLVSEDGSVFFVGLAKRGEDGEQAKGRRQPKAGKPKKMMKMEGKRVEFVACNHGSSAIVTKTGELYIFGKDAHHVDRNTGLVVSLKNIVISQVAIGKAHILALSNKGHVYTFGISNKGQCGLDLLQATSTKDLTHNQEAMEDGNIEQQIDMTEDVIEPLCSLGHHRWKYEQCMICTICGECTGYGSACIASGKSERNPGMCCGCGAGDAGCTDCGCCRACETIPKEPTNVEENDGSMLPLNRMAYNVASQLNLCEPNAAEMQRFATAFSLAEVGMIPSATAANDLRNNELNYEELPVRSSNKGDASINRLNPRIERRRIGLDVLGRRLRHASKAYRNLVGAAGKANIADSGGDHSAQHFELIDKAVSNVINIDIDQGSDGETSKLTPLPPTRLNISSRITQIACGLHHSVLLTSSGDVLTFGSNQHGQLGHEDFAIREVPTKVRINATIVQIAAGSNHTALLSSYGQVYTFGSNQKGQLGRSPNAIDYAWNAIPGIIPNVGQQFGRKATWISASGDHTFVKLDESLINPLSLSSARVITNRRCIAIIAPNLEMPTNDSDFRYESSDRKFHSLVISRVDGSCKSFNTSDQLELSKFSAVCLDNNYDVLWTYNSETHSISRYNIIASEAKMPNQSLSSILLPELALPQKSSTKIKRTTVALNLLCTLETLTSAHQLGWTIQDDEQSKNQIIKTYSKDDFQTVCRFESHGGGWGFSSHSIEAIRFMTDTDILLGGFGLFGGRGEYTAKLKLFDIGADGGEQEGDGEILTETEEIPFECASRQKYPILFDEPISLQANRWYVAWARISGPSSDCGSSGQSVVTTEDQVIFYFKSSKKSNNGTDVNAGQIPQLLYKVYSGINDISNYVSCRSDYNSIADETISIIGREFSLTVTYDCFQSLLKLLRWSWQTFKSIMFDINSFSSDNSSAIHSMILELKHLKLICCASLHLLKIYINEIFPNKHEQRIQTTTNDSIILAECIYDVRTLFKVILSEPPEWAPRNQSYSDDVNDLIRQIMCECHESFLSCYHAFYPTSCLRWRGLCDLLLKDDQNNSVYLLSAMLASLCRPWVRLTQTFPMMHGFDVYNLQSPSDIQSPNSDIGNYQNSILSEKMLEKSDKEGCHSGSECSFRDIINKLLKIIGKPIEDYLQQENIEIAERSNLSRNHRETRPTLQLVENACDLLSTILSELVAQITGIGFDPQILTGQQLHITPSRFSRISQNRTWNTGNGSPDAICFSVDKPGISIAGITVYGGIGNEWHYELELLDYYGIQPDERTVARDAGQSWRTLDMIRGSYAFEDKAVDVCELKFERAIPISPNVKYAIRLKNHGPRTNNGDGGLTHIRGPDNTTFTFSDCSLSFNGTNHARGQIPQILYYSAPQSFNSESIHYPINEEIPRKNSLSISDSVISLAINLLVQAQEYVSSQLIMRISSSHLIKKLLPLTLAYLSPIATSDCKSSIQILSMIRQLLPLVVYLNKSNDFSISNRSLSPLPSCLSAITTSRHYVTVESDHPYKPAFVYNYKVKFPQSVKWMCVEFDSRCATAQPEDSLQLFVPSLNATDSWDANKNSKNSEQTNTLWPILRKFKGRSNCWPSNSIVIPSNELIFSLETASDYVKEEKASYYGFKCQVIGYENPLSDGYLGLQYLEQELTYLSGICIGTLLKKNINLPQIGGETEENLELALRTFELHSTLLSKGLSLSHPIIAHEALDGILPLANEHPFLKDFCALTPGTSGARLAKWFQCESFVDPTQCEVLCSCVADQELQCGWPTVITIITRDQYGNMVNVPNLKVEVSAQPFHSNANTQLKHSKTDVSVPPSAQNVHYSITSKDKMFYHAITMMKQYENYSFEELRYVSPIKRRTMETMLVRSNNDGTYTANWTPGSTGWYQLKITVDGVTVNSSQSVQVGEPTKTVPLPLVQAVTAKSAKKAFPSRTRRFVGRNSAGLRIRSLPSLQSEQIGVLEINGIITIIEELHNDDGVWVRLALESIQKYCNTNSSQQQLEAWCLQFNQHLGKTLLVPIGESKPIVISNGPTSSVNSEKKFPDLRSVRRKKYSLINKQLDFPAFFHVVKCGVSGHNIRSKPHLRAPPVGMVVLGNVVSVVADVTNSSGTWVKLDDESMKRYCFNTDGEGWSLSRTINDVIYLQHEAEVMHITDEEDDDSKYHNSNYKSFSRHNGLPAIPFVAHDDKSANVNTNIYCSSNVFDKSLSSNKELMSLNSVSQSIASESEVESIPNDSFISGMSPSLVVNTFAEFEKTDIDTSAYCDSSVNDSISSATTAGSRVAALQKKFLHESDSKSYHKNANRSLSESPSREPPPELVGINVKELVKAIRDQSPTPPNTPPLKRTPVTSRSSSPNVSVCSSKRSVQPTSASIAIKSSAHSSPINELNSNNLRPSLYENTVSFDKALNSNKVEVQRKSFIQKATQTSPPDDVSAIHSYYGQFKLANDSHLKSPQTSPSASPKQNRIAKDSSRSSRQSRSKRDKTISPSNSSNFVPFQANTSNNRMGAIPVKEAISNSVAECIRSVFAAFIWHEGILHDTLAAASYLKFNPEVTKETVKSLENDHNYDRVKLRPYKKSDSKGSTKEEKAKFRHSVEVSQLSALQQQECYLNANIDQNNKIAEMEIPIQQEFASINEINNDLPMSQSEESANDSVMIPETLVNLLKLWEVVSTCVSNAIIEPPVSVITPANLTPPSTPVQMFNKIQNNPKLIQPNCDEIYNEQTRMKTKQLNDASNTNAAKASILSANRFVNQLAQTQSQSQSHQSRGNLFGEAALANNSAHYESRESAHSSLCELCGNSYPYPVTHHMRKTHPGCGEHAGGKGYNSSGSFCGGWAGHCGDGGIGSSNWYLICDKCRDKYLTQKRYNNKGANAKSKHSTAAEPKSLHLNSPVNTNISSPITPMEVHQIIKENALFLLRMSPANDMSGISSAWNSVKTKQTQEFLVQSSSFQCLENLGIHHSTYHQRLAEEHLSEDDIRAIQNGRPSKISSVDENFANDFPKKSIKTEEPHKSLSSRSSFHRSVSVGLTDWQQEKVILTQRKRATSNDNSSTTFLCQPSATLINLVHACCVVDTQINLQSKLTQSFDNNVLVALLNRPIMQFILQQHHLNALLIAMKNALRKCSCRTLALNALNWLLRNVSQTVSLHDLMWCFVASLTPNESRNGGEKDESEENVANGVISANAANIASNVSVGSFDRRDDNELHYYSQTGICQHPLADLSIAGEAAQFLTNAFHAFLQTVSDLMPLLPMGSPLQQIAVRCFCINFDTADHSFLHQCHVFSNISKIFSRTEEENSYSEEMHQSVIHPIIESYQDITPQMEIKASSRQAMIGSLTDNSTETFWESGDEDRNKTKTITINNNAGNEVLSKIIYIHIDNVRDLGSKVSQITFKYGDIGLLDTQMIKLKVVEVENRFTGWIHCVLPSNQAFLKSFKLEFKGPDNTLRLRQIKVLGLNISRSQDNIKPVLNSIQIQQANCEAETLRVFRLLTSQVFGKLISGEADLDGMKNEAPVPTEQTIEMGSSGAANDLREHMVGILFSRSGKLTFLQKQVCAHIVQAIRVEAIRLREEWETLLCSKSSSITIGSEIPSDAYCFEMLSMVLALSGSTVGRQYLALQNDLLLDLFSLLHTGSARVQRQVTSLLRRVLPEIKPSVFASMFGISALPSRDIIVSNEKEQFDVHNVGILDVFLACIAKSLTVQTKVKGLVGSSSKTMTTITLATAIHPRDYLGDRWWLRGCLSRKLSECIISLLKDMASGKLSDSWASVAKNAIAQNILNLTRMSENYRTPAECIKTPTLWIALASLCVLEQEHAERLSSSHWVNVGDQANGNQQSRPLCDNHDDGETPAIILCNNCGNLCAECDRYLHLHSKTRNHQRQVFKEEEEAIKVDLHEGCGRTKLFWVMALADSKTLKAMVEFRGENTRTKIVSAISGQKTLASNTTGICRFCGTTGSIGLLAMGNICSEPECQEYAKNACNRVLSCGHPCGGIVNEEKCLPCLHGCSGELKQDGDDMCMICFSEALSCAPVIQLKCGHLFHRHCCKAVLITRWPGPRITFSFSLCPICKNNIEHYSLQELLLPIKNLFDDVHRKALMRLEYEGLHRCEAITVSGARFFNDPASYAMERYAYYVCCKCKKAYYGGEARCDADAGIGDNYDPSELVCGGCSDVSRAQMCPKHGTDFLEYKCRYCCSVAVFFCFGTTHFCNACHDDFQKLTNLREFPKCPAGPRGKQLEGDECPLHVKHPPTGEEFALGCGVCRNAHTF